jgi:hypothetical protein
MLGAALAQQGIRRFGVRNVGAVGIAMASAGLFVLTQLPVHGSYVDDLLPGLLPLGLGLGLAFVPITLLGTSGVREQDNGLASGLFNTAQQVGGSLGLAILSTLAASQAANVLHGTSSAAITVARVSGYHVAFLAAAIMLAAGAVILVVALRKTHMREVEAAIEAGVQPLPA